MVKSNAPPTTTTRVICLTSSKSLTLTPSKSNSGANNSGAPLMIQRKKGKIEYFTLGANKNQNSSATTPKKSGTTPKKLPSGVTTVLIPKLTGGPGQKIVKKDISNTEVDTKQNNGPTATTASSSGDNTNASSSKSLVANYSDNSSPDDDSNKTSPVGAVAALEMEVDEDGAPLPSATPMLKRPSPDSTSNEEVDSAKKAKVDVDDAVDHNAALVTSSNDA